MKLREIERLRAVAVLLVLVVHQVIEPRMFPEVYRVPWSGVDLFFVISGFVVTLSLVRLLPSIEGETSFIDAYDRSKGALKAFYVRRFFRILPAAITVMLVNRVLAGALPNTFGTVNDWWHEFLAFLGGIYNYGRAFHSDWRMGIYWSLAVEEHFYLMLPMLFIAFRTRNRRLLACLGIALACILARQVKDGISDTEDYQKFVSHLRFDSLMAGVALALTYDRPRTPPILPKNLFRFVILPTVIVVIAGLPRVAPWPVLGHFGFVAIWMLSGLLVFYAAQDKGYVLSFPVVDRVLEYLGSRSYSLYLVHVTVERFETSQRAFWPAYDKWLPIESEWGSHWKRTLFRTLLCILVAEGMYRVIEQPFIRLGKRFIDAQKTGATVRAPWMKGIGIAAAAVVTLVYSRHFLLQTFGPANLARGTAVYASSVADGAPHTVVLTDGRLEPEKGLDTTNEDDPWAMIDLGYKRPIGAVRVYNRADGFEMQNVPIELQISDDGQHFSTIATRELVFTQEWPWRIMCSDMAPRFIRLRSPKKTTLCLSEVEVYEAKWPAALP